MSAELEKLCIKCQKRKAADGNNYCTTCIGGMKRSSYPNKHRFGIKNDVEVQSRKLLRELMDNNEITVELREWDTDFNPFDALMDVVQEQMQWKDICLAKLAKLKEDEWRWDGDRAGEQLRSEIVLYERAIDRAVKTLERIARLGIEERLMRIAERQVAIVETAIVRTLQELNISPDVQAAARTRIIRHLKAS